MTFDSIAYISCFLPLSVAVYWLLPGTKGKNALLLVISLAFYAFGGVSGMALLLLTALANWLFGLLIQKGKAAKALMITAVTADLAFLGAYKYLDFFLAQLLGEPAIQLGLTAPIGISFFTFKCISYVVDTYREKDKGSRSFYEVLLYISFFPQVMSGPITRFYGFRAQLGKRRWDLDTVANGLRRFVIGLGKKLFLAATFGTAADKVFALEVLDIRLAWVGAIAYLLQIYFDFSGYSDMAIGLGGVFGFTTPENFNYPYIAASIGDFWRRWHISLSSWFKDYLYIPLGGNRKGKAHAALNKAIVFTLCGFWHGASWTFLVWGLWHGLLSALESLNIIPAKKLGKVWGRVYTLLAVCLGFVMFRANSVEQGFLIIGAMFTGFRFTEAATVALHSIVTPQLLVMTVVGIVAATPVIPRLRQGKHAQLLETCSWALVLVLYVLCLPRLAAGGFAPFIYFQF